MAHPRLNGSLALAFVRVIRDIRAVFLLFAVAQQLRSLVAQLVVRCALCPVPCALYPRLPSPLPFLRKIRDSKDLQRRNPSFSILNPQDVPDRPCSIRNILRIAFQFPSLCAATDAT